MATNSGPPGERRIRVDMDDAGQHAPQDRHRFEATFEHAVAELLQNARRSGATRIEVRTTATELTVEDNGCGVDDPLTLLAPGKSAWRNGTPGEKPEGMGLHALAHYTPHIEWRTGEDRVGWKTTLGPEQFDGTAEAVVRPCRELVGGHGTRVRIERTPEHGDEEAIAAACRHLPVRVMLNGKPAEQEEYLAECVHEVEYPRARPDALGVKVAAGSTIARCEIVALMSKTCFRNKSGDNEEWDNEFKAFDTEAAAAAAKLLEQEAAAVKRSIEQIAANRIGRLLGTRGARIAVSSDGTEVTIVERKEPHGQSGSAGDGPDDDRRRAARDELLEHIKRLQKQATAENDRARLRSAVETLYDPRAGRTLKGLLQDLEVGIETAQGDDSQAGWLVIAAQHLVRHYESM